MAFIDAILCGFGAVVLLFLIINSQARAHRVEQTLQLRAEAERLKERVEQGKRNLVEIRNTMEKQSDEQKRFEGLSRQIIEIERLKKEQLARLEQNNLASRKHLNRLQTDVQSAEVANKRLKAGATTAIDQGERVREHQGDGKRQYLTGLKLNGRRTLILVDSSASMLAETIVNAVIRRNQPYAKKVRARKWRRTLRTVDWLSAQLPVKGKFLIASFNDKATVLPAGSGSGWQSVSDPQALNRAVAAVYKLDPGKGTNLQKAFALARGLKPAPDNIILITDGLPTLGTSNNWRGKASPEKRLAHFKEALRQLPGGIAVNIILYPMEGDPGAAPAFWKLALRTGGSLFSPSRDWP